MPEQTEQKNWLELFQNPPSIYRPIPFWSWNEDLESDEVKRQLRLFKKAGWGGAILHARIGLLTPIMSEKWFEVTQAAIEQAKKSDMDIWLYDEDKWPSGYGGGAVPLENPDYRMKMILARPADAPIPKGARSIDSGNGLKIYQWSPPLGNPRFNGTCYADTLNSKAMKVFLREMYEPYVEHFDLEFGRAVKGIFTDEPAATFLEDVPQGCIPWSESVRRIFHEMYDSDLMGQLHLLFTNDPNAPAFRIQYFRAMNRAFETAYSQQLGDWCQRRNLQLTGHYMNEHGIPEQQSWGVKIMPNYRHQQVPGIDHLGRQVQERLTAKQCQSVVNQFGKSRMLSEIYGTCGDSLTFEDRLWIASQQMCMGVNLLNPHLSLYTMAGCRKRDYPQNISYQQPFWPLNEQLDTPISRICTALSRGEYLPQLLVLHPQESAFALWEMKTDFGKDSDKLVWQTGSVMQNIDKLTELDKEYKQLLNCLFANQFTFDLGDETILAENGCISKSNGQPAVQIQKMKYPVVLLPSMYTIAESTVDLLKEFQQAGGKVIHCGRQSEWIDGRPDTKLNKWLETVETIVQNELPKRLLELCPDLIHSKNCKNASHLMTHVRELPENERLFYLVNLDRTQTVSGKLTLFGPGKNLYLLNAFSGKLETVEIQNSGHNHGVSFSADFLPAQGRLFLLSPKEYTARPAELSIPSPVKTHSAKIESLQRLDENCLILDYAQIIIDGQNIFKKPIPIIAIQKFLESRNYTGPIELLYEMQTGNLDTEKKLQLCVEHPEWFEISVNGTHVQYKGLPFWRDIRWLPLDITGLVKEGKNQIRFTLDRFIPGDMTNTEDYKARYGTELEAIYLAGDFSVNSSLLDEKPVSKLWQEYDLPEIDVKTVDRKSLSLTNPKPLGTGDCTTQGLPFYAGRLALHLPIPESVRKESEENRIFLALDLLDCTAAQVEVDKQNAGYIFTYPYQIELTNFITSQSNKITIILYNSLRNLLGPHHHIDGEIPWCGPDHFVPAFESDELYSYSVEKWARNECQPFNWKDRYCIVSFGNIGTIRFNIIPKKRTSAE